MKKTILLATAACCLTGAALSQTAVDPAEVARLSAEHPQWAGWLADPALAEYRIVADPQTMTVYDLTPIPPDRAARLTCSKS